MLLKEEDEWTDNIAHLDGFLLLSCSGLRFKPSFHHIGRFAVVLSFHFFLCLSIYLSLFYGTLLTYVFG